MMIRIPTHREPTHPGEMLLEVFLSPMGLTQRDLADALHVPYQRVNELVNGRRGVTPSTALRLGKYFGMSADFLDESPAADRIRHVVYVNAFLPNAGESPLGMFDSSSVASFREGCRACGWPVYTIQSDQYPQRTARVPLVELLDSIP